MQIHNTAGPQVVKFVYCSNNNNNASRLERQINNNTFRVCSIPLIILLCTCFSKCKHEKFA